MVSTETEISLLRPYAFSCYQLTELLDKYFHSPYQVKGTSRLPILAFYTLYECLMNETKRFKNKQLLPLLNHRSINAKIDRIGDIEVIDENKRCFEAITFTNKKISLQLLLEKYHQFWTTGINRYYILSTAPQAEKEEWKKIQAEIQRIKNVHGCQLIVNGIMPSLKYYLRLLDNTFEFVDKYVNLLENDTALKFEHKQNWNKIISELQ